MSFSFSTTGTREEVLSRVGTAPQDSNAPEDFCTVIASQLSLLPENASVQLSAFGHTGWGQSQLSGEISLHCTIQASVPQEAGNAEAS